jgi:hypothetical protein
MSALMGAPAVTLRASGAASSRRSRAAPAHGVRAAPLAARAAESLAGREGSATLARRAPRAAAARGAAATTAIFVRPRVLRRAAPAAPPRRRRAAAAARPPARVRAPAARGARLRRPRAHWPIALPSLTRRSASAQANPFGGAFQNPFETRKTVIITGASSGLGKATTEVLAQSGKWHVIMVRARERSCCAATRSAPRRRCGAQRALAPHDAPPHGARRGGVARLCARRARRRCGRAISSVCRATGASAAS